MNEGFDNLNIDYNEVQELPEPLSEEEIIKRISGYDRTDGSCVSLAYAYAANKAGLDVLDFRGGDSRRFFALSGCVENMANLEGVESWTERFYNEEKGAISLMEEKMETGKEYILSAGKHAGVVKHEGGHSWKYLELQDEYKEENTWKNLTRASLRSRFETTRSCHIYGMESTKKVVLIDVESLGKSSEFRELAGYFNTSESAQQKEETRKKN